MTHDDILERLKQDVAEAGYAEVARRLGLSPSYVWNVAHGGKTVGPRMAAAMGYKRVIEYRLMTREEVVEAAREN